MTNSIKIETNQPVSTSAGTFNVVHLEALRAAFGDRVRIVVLADEAQRAELGDTDVTEWIDGSIDVELGDKRLTSEEVVAAVGAQLTPTLDVIRQGVCAAFREFERDVLQSFGELATTTSNAERCRAGICGAMDGLELDLLQSVDDLAAIA